MNETFSLALELAYDLRNCRYKTCYMVRVIQCARDFERALYRNRLQDASPEDFDDEPCPRDVAREYDAFCAALWKVADNDVDHFEDVCEKAHAALDALDEYEGVMNEAWCEQ